VIHFYEHLGFDTDVDTFEQVSREFIGDYEKRWFDECRLHSGTHEVLSAMTQLGMTHSVLSAAKQEALESGIWHYGIHEHFMGLVGTNNIYAEGKIARGKQWIQELPWKPDEVVMIGDTLHDHEVAEAIGADCILLAHGHHTPERLATTGKLVVHSLRELVDVVR
jgi:phosphoglycolate phosphatase